MPAPYPRVRAHFSIDEAVGKRLRSARRHQGYPSASAFALQRNIPLSTYSQYETGKRRLSSALIVYFCDLLRVSPTWLLTGESSLKNKVSLK